MAGVVVNHLTGHPQGGFVGVDVFFVISGFLITGQLVAAHERRDPLQRLPFSQNLRALVADFYRRRVRRILPAAVVVIAATAITTRVLLPGPRASHIGGDAASALAFVSNWRFATGDVDYFTVDRPVSPLQNFWSLSVEEQFYVLWPLIAFAVAAFAARRSVPGRHQRETDTRGLSVRFAVAMAATTLAVASLAYAWHESHSDSNAAYFSTASRAWELGVGAILAVALPGLRQSSVRAWWLSAAGTVIVVVSYFTARGGDGFPAPGALLPCLGAALVLAAHDQGLGARNPILTNPAAVRVGDLSYSLYLVHFPVIIIVSAIATTHGFAYYATAVTATVGLAALLFSLVEQPVLRSRWLLGPHEAARRSPAGLDWRITVAALTSLAVAAGTYATIPSKSERDAADYRRVAGSISSGPPPARTSPGTPSTTPARPVPATPQADIVTRYLDQALLAKTYPSDLSPSMTDVIDGPQARDPFVACSRPELGSVDGCTWGDPAAKHLIYLTGDSTAMVWAEALAHVVEHLPGWRLRVAAGYGCHFSSVVYEIPYKPLQDTCASHRQDVDDEIAEMHPDVLLVSGAYYRFRSVDAAKDVSIPQFASQQLQAIKAVSRFVTRTVVLEPPPGGTSPGSCYQPGDPPVACVYRPKPTWLAISDAMRSTMTSAGVVYVPSTRWFCNSAGYCPPFADGTPIMHDKSHAAPGWMDVVWPAVGEALRLRHVFG